MWLGQTAFFNDTHFFRNVQTLVKRWMGRMDPLMVLDTILLLAPLLATKSSLVFCGETRENPFSYKTYFFFYPFACGVVMGIEKKLTQEE